MTYRLSDSDIDRLIDEDIPYGDLTTALLGISERAGEIVFTTRESTTLCCTEEAARILEKCGASVKILLPSGTEVKSGATILSATGSAGSLHAGWKAALNMLEYASGIATRTNRIVSRATAFNPAIRVVTTRKSFPGTKKIALKAIMAGGAVPHRLGLSDSILLFRQHALFLGGHEKVAEAILSLKAKAPEHKIVAEAECEEEAMLLAAAGAEIIQLDKLDPAPLGQLVLRLHAGFPDLKISAAGGINGENAAEYAATGVDMLVLSSPYFGKPADIGVAILPVMQQ
ncbi:MAG: ModD protein [Chlorobiaceae bacterium]